MKTQFFVEVTDTFGGESNYSWVNRYMVTATTERGAMRKVSRDFGFTWRKTLDCGGFQRWDAKGACVCAFVQSPDNCGLYKVVEL